MVSAGAFLAMKDTLICFDDIERKGDQLSIKDFFGLVSVLKEQKNCKIVLILNESSLLPSESDEFKKHSEKIVDIEVQFEPLTQEVFDIVFPKDYPQYEFLKQCCLKLEMKNIRIVKRIKRRMDEILPYLKGVSAEVEKRITHSLALYVWCYFNKEESLPSLEFLVGYHQIGFRLQFQDKDKELDAQQKDWHELLSSYDYYSTDDIDKCLISWMKTGYLDLEGFLAEVSEKDEKIKNQNLWDKAWELYPSFEDNEKEFVDKLSSSFRMGLAHRTSNELNSLVDVFRGLGYEELTNQIIDEYFTEHATDNDIIRLQHSAFRDDFKDSYLLNKLQEVWKKKQNNMTLTDVVKAITSRNSWGVEDIRFLAECEVEEYYGFFKSLTSSDMYFHIRSCLLPGESENVNENEKIVAQKAKRALIKIAEENPFNRLRVENIFKIKID